MAQFLKSQTPDELWKASLKPRDPFKPEDPAKGEASGAATTSAGKAPGTGLVLDISA